MTNHREERHSKEEAAKAMIKNKKTSQKLVHRVLSRGGGGGSQVVSVLAFCSNEPNDIFFFKIVFEKNENKQKEAWVGPLTSCIWVPTNKQYRLLR